MIDGFGSRARALLQVQNGCDIAAMLLIPFVAGSRAQSAGSLGPGAAVEAGTRERLRRGMTS